MMKNSRKFFQKESVIFKCRRDEVQKNIKELLAPSTTRSREIDEDNDIENEEDQNMEEGCYPCGKPCAYCHLLEKSQGKTFKSKSNKKCLKFVNT